MRIPRNLAWLLILITMLTAGLLRQFHDRTPHSPYVPPVVGSLLFAGVVFLLLVAAREWRLGAVREHGIRLGSVTPLLLMLLVEKWTSLAVYNPVFYALSPADATPAELDRYYILFAGFGLLAICVLLAQFSRPAGRRTWRLAHPARWPRAAGAALMVVVATYLLLAGLSAAFGAGFKLEWPERHPLLYLDLGGQAVLAFSEELYYRGLLLTELHRLGPRLGLRSPTGRHWFAVIATSVMFGMEHFRIGTDPVEMARALVFTVSLGMLFGILVLITNNLHFVAGVHAWINWLLLGAAPRFVDEAGVSVLPPGTYIAVTLIFSFVLAFLLRQWRRRRPGGA